MADSTSVCTCKGFVYTVSVADVYSLNIVGWVLSDPMRIEALPPLALNQAIVSAKETNRRTDSSFIPRGAICEHCLFETGQGSTSE